MPTNYVISRIGKVAIGPAMATEANCIDVGSTRDASIKPNKGERSVATAAKFNDAEMEVAYFGPTAEGTMTLEEITSANAILAMGLTDTAGALQFRTDGVDAVYKAIYVHGFKIDGVPKTLHIPRCEIATDTDMKAGGKEQQLLAVTFTAKQDPSLEFLFEWVADTLDVTAPTVASVVPAAGATAVSKAATTLVVVTFSEAVRSEDITPQSFMVINAAGVVVAGTRVVAADNLSATFTPSAAYAATSVHHVVVAAGIRDVAGNKLAATSSTIFTTAA